MPTKTTGDFNPAKSNFSAKGWAILILAFFSILLMSSIVYDSLNVTIPAFGEIRGWDVSILYLFSTIAAWISVLGATVWGIVCTKKTCRLAWVLSLGLAGAACFLWTQAVNPAIYFVCLALANIGGMGFAYIASLNVVSNWFPRKKGLAMGWVTIGFPLSATIATPLCSALLSMGGISTIYITYGIACVVLCVIVALYVRDYPEEKGAFPDNDQSFDRDEANKQLREGLEYIKISPWTPKKLFHTKNVWFIIFSLGVMELLSLGIMTNFMPRMLQIGYEQAEVIPMLAIAGLIACIGSYLCGVMDAKIGPKKATAVTLLLGIIAIVLNVTGGIIKQGGNSGLATTLIYISLPFLGVMLGGAANYLVSITNTIWGRYDFNMAYRVLKPMVAVVGALGITICGGLGNAGPGYGVAYMVLGALAVIALIVICLVDDAMVGKK